MKPQSSGRWRSGLTVALAAAAAGAVVLGVGGRIAMAALSIADGKRPAFSWGGSLEVVLLGAIYGAIGGLPLAAIRHVWPRAGWWRGVALGVLMLGVAWASSTVGRQTAASAPTARWVVAGVAAAVFVVYGILADRLASAWQTRAITASPPESIS